MGSGIGFRSRRCGARSDALTISVGAALGLPGLDKSSIIVATSAGAASLPPARKACRAIAAAGGSGATSARS